MSFTTEKSLLEPSIMYIPQYLNFSDMYILGTEVPVSYRTADLGFIPIADWNRENHDKGVLSKLSQSELLVLANFVSTTRGDQKDASSYIERQINNSNLDKIVENLLNLGLLKYYTDGNLSSSDWLLYQFGPAILVELKISRWIEAFHQALFYLSRSDLSCVVLDAKYCKSVDLDLFRDSGIGLFYAWENNFEMVISPKLSDNSDPVQKTYIRLKAIQDISRNKPRKWGIKTCKV